MFLTGQEFKNPLASELALAFWAWYHDDLSIS
jgi:hypothetical protein